MIYPAAAAAAATVRFAIGSAAAAFALLFYPATEGRRLCRGIATRSTPTCATGIGPASRGNSGIRRGPIDVTAVQRASASCIGATRAQTAGGLLRIHSLAANASPAVQIGSIRRGVAADNGAVDVDLAKAVVDIVTPVNIHIGLVAAYPGTTAAPPVVVGSSSIVVVVVLSQAR